jgi:hypothetical protein
MPTETRDDEDLVTCEAVGDGTYEVAFDVRGLLARFGLPDTPAGRAALALAIGRWHDGARRACAEGTLRVRIAGGDGPAVNLTRSYEA